MSADGNRWTDEMRRAFHWLRTEEDAYSRYMSIVHQMENPGEFILKDMAKREGKIAGYRMAFNLGLGKKRFKETY